MPPPPPVPPLADQHLPPILVIPLANPPPSSNMANNQNNNPLGGPVAAEPRERASATVDVVPYQHGKDDFDEWVELLESAISLATNATGNNHEQLCKRWLPLKLDAASRAIYKRADKTLAWAALKTELKKLFVDPQDAYRWQAKRSTIKWDGKESFHLLASRIMTAVAKFDGNLPEDLKEKELFFRFREALPKDYQKAIDMGCGKNDRQLEKAVDIADRARMTLEQDEPKSVTFANARFEENRTSGLELALTKMDSKLDTMVSTLSKHMEMQANIQAKNDSRFDNLEKAVAGLQAERANSSQNRPSRSEYCQPSPLHSEYGLPPLEYQSQCPPQQPFGNSTSSSFYTPSPHGIQFRDYSPYPDPQYKSQEYSPYPDPQYESQEYSPYPDPQYQSQEYSHNYSGQTQNYNLGKYSNDQAFGGQSRERYRSLNKDHEQCEEKDIPPTKRDTKYAMMERMMGEMQLQKGQSKKN